jgi:hypothetical protein
VDRRDDRQLRAGGVDDLAVLDPGADDLDRRAVAVDVVGAVLAIVLDDDFEEFLGQLLDARTRPGAIRPHHPN